MYLSGDGHQNKDGCIDDEKREKKNGKQKRHLRKKVAGHVIT